MLNFCIKSIPNIGFKYVPKEEMESLRREHEAKYANVTDHVLGTRSYHQFVSFDQNRFGAKRCSGDDAFECTHHFSVLHEQDIKQRYAVV